MKKAKQNKPPAPDMWVTPKDIALIRQHAIERAALMAGVDKDLISFKEIPDAVQFRDPELGRALHGFLSALQQWYDFHVRNAGRPGRSDQQELVRLVQVKEERREALIRLTELPGQETARLWVHDELEAVLQRMAIEIPELEQNHWYWRFHSKESEVIFPIDSFASDIMESQMAFTDTFKKLVLEHDQRREELIGSLAKAQEDLGRDAIFSSKVLEIVNAHKQRHPDDRPWGAFQEDRAVALAAQYVLNRMGKVDVGSTMMAHFWNENREQIMGIPGAVDKLRQPDLAGKALVDVAKKLRAEADRLRRILRSRYDIAPRTKDVLRVPERF